MRNIIQLIGMIALFFGLSGCVVTTRGERYESFEVSAADIGCVESSVYTVRDTGTTTTRVATKTVMVEIERLTSVPFDDVVFTVRREDTSARSGLPCMANIDVVHGRRDRYRITVLIDERDVPTKDIVVDVSAGGTTTHVLFNRVDSPSGPTYRCYKQGEGRAHLYDGAGWNPQTRRFLIEETPLDTLLTARAN